MADELDRWIAAVRPHTDADDGWAATTAGAQALAAIQAGGRSRHTTSRRRRAWSAGGVGLATAACAIVALAAVGPPSQHVPPAARPPAGHTTRVPLQMALAGYNTCPAALAALRAHTAASTTLVPSYQMYAYDAQLGGAARSAVVPDAVAAQGQPDHSSTNVQEAGVDEPDIVKTDGTRIVTVVNGVLRVVDAKTRKLTGTLRLTKQPQYQPANLLLFGDRALVVLQPQGFYGTVQASASAGAGPAYTLVELSGLPTVIGTFTPNGNYVDARMIGSTVRLVVSSAPNIKYPTANWNQPEAKRLAAAKSAVLAAPLRAWQPTYQVTQDGVTANRVVPCDQIQHPAQYTGQTMLTVYTIDLTKGLGALSPISLAADGDTVYATASSLYIASNPAWFGCCLRYDVIVGGARPRPSLPQRTQIHRFDITSFGAPRYLGSGSVPGRLLSSYSLSDYDGHLRVVATAVTSKGVSTTSVYVLDADTLKVTGSAGGLGRGQQVYAVRFAGPVAYVVTFRMLDPLYVLDLHDPADPREVGQLELTGYSSYLFPLPNGQLIGVGQDGNSKGLVTGLQVSLFDVSDPAAPTRLAHVVGRDLRGEGQLDPHAFLYWPAKGLIVVPIDTWKESESGKALALHRSGSQLTRLGTITHPRHTGPSDYVPGIQRSMVVDGSLWTMSSAGLKVSDLSTLADQGWIPFS